MDNTQDYGSWNKGSTPLGGTKLHFGINGSINDWLIGPT